MKDINDYKLTDTVTVGEVRYWLANRDDTAKKKIIMLIDHRFTNRYIKHLSTIDSGFLMMAISCLTIETLESFKQGEKNTNGKSKKMFKDFFLSEKSHFPDFSGICNDFYSDIRCGILHQAETTNAWRILRTGPLLIESDKVINARRFVEALEKSIEDYIKRLQGEDWNSVIWKNAIVKIEDICDNCEETK
ncbi:hypothetical protein SAMN05660461_0949 [Chitinophaga ginsengisegetis]|uniref:Apea-like HEPN domain-containing protein n=1 Tax=Chitinophaga ginsengisegetis TaxID=393003 RepID=A0A1T5NBI9_9BACT|nr:hypothetical protein [Chitinophaga ginsengisegetis]SKC97569.1 hypothetical protein SAMN05660461_0949 [Chitinophaga ginsengisegetis]